MLSRIVSSPFGYQTYLAQARSTEVAAKAAYSKSSEIALERATATILDGHHLVLDDAYRGNVPAAR